LLALSASREEKAVSPLRSATALQIIVSGGSTVESFRALKKILQPIVRGICENVLNDSFKLVIYDIDPARQGFSVVVIKPSPFLVLKS